MTDEQARELLAVAAKPAVGRIAIEVVHDWVQRLPLRDGQLICVNCRQSHPISGARAETLSCAEVAAWTTPGASACGDFVVMPAKGGQ